jgi:glycosyltransferase involved in cell wall biosynthesis
MREEATRLRPDLDDRLKIGATSTNIDRPSLYVWSGLGAQFGAVTGVGRHVKNMGLQLLGDPAWNARLVLARDQAQHQDDSAYGPPAVARLPLPRIYIDALWTLFGRPNIERWLDGPGWIYCPKEKFVPTRALRCAVTVHDIYAFEPGQVSRGPAENLRRRRFQRMLGQANIVFVVSHFTKERLLERFAADAAKIVVVGNGVEDIYFSAGDLDPHSCRGELQPYVLLVGGLRKKKGAVDILRFADALERVDSSMSVVAVGPVDPEFAGETSARRNLRVLPRGVPDSEMARLVRGASVALSLSVYEGFGIPLLEAMAAGVPVVAAARSAFPEVVGEAGILVDPGAPKTVAGIVRDLARDEPLRATYVTRGRRRAADFSWAACAQRVSRAMRACDRGEPLC